MSHTQKIKLGENATHIAKEKGLKMEELSSQNAYINISFSFPPYEQIEYG